MLKIVEYSANLAGKVTAAEIKNSLFLLRDMAVFWPFPIFGDKDKHPTGVKAEIAPNLSEKAGPELGRLFRYLESFPEEPNNGISQTKALTGKPVAPEWAAALKRYLLEESQSQNLQPDVILSLHGFRPNPNNGYEKCKLDGKKKNDLNFRSYPLWMRSNFVFEPKRETGAVAAGEVRRFYAELLRVLLAFPDEDEIYLYDENFCALGPRSRTNFIMKHYLDCFFAALTTHPKLRLCFIACAVNGTSMATGHAVAAFNFVLKQYQNVAARLRLETYAHSAERIHNRYLASSRHVLVPDQGANILRIPWDPQAKKWKIADMITVTSPWRFENLKTFKTKMGRVCKPPPTATASSAPSAAGSATWAASYLGYGSGDKKFEQNFLHRIAAKLRPAAQAIG